MIILHMVLLTDIVTYDQSGIKLIKIKNMIKYFKNQMTNYSFMVSASSFKKLAFDPIVAALSWSKVAQQTDQSSVMAADCGSTEINDVITLYYISDSCGSTCSLSVPECYHQIFTSADISPADISIISLSSDVLYVTYFVKMVALEGKH